MKIAVHITFFFVEKRFKYLKKVVDNLLQIDAFIDIYIYTNKKNDVFKNFKNVKILVYPYTKGGIKFHHTFIKLGMKKMVHPFYLTWENRKIIENEINNYDIQVYLEDDIKFTQANLNYWLKYNKTVTKEGYNLGFLRVEHDGEDRFLTDLKKSLSTTLTIDKKKYIINDNNSYCGFWIYSKKELKEFIKSKEWRFNFKSYGIREKSAIGWHGKSMKRYTATIIPLKEENDIYVMENDCTVHHMPNNYLNHPHFCSIKFPITLPIDNKHDNL